MRCLSIASGEDLKAKRPRMMAVLDPVKVIIDNYPEGQVEYLEVDNNVENPELGKRKVPLQENYMWKEKISWRNHQRNISVCSREMKFVS